MKIAIYKKIIVEFKKNDIQQKKLYSVRTYQEQEG